MAQYWFDWSNSPLGDPPNGVSVPWSVPSTFDVVEAITGSHSVRNLRISHGANINAFLRLDALTGVAGLNDIKIRFRVNRSTSGGTAQQMSGATLMSGAGTSNRNGLTGGMHGEAMRRITRWFNNTSTILGTTAQSGTHDVLWRYVDFMVTDSGSLRTISTRYVREDELPLPTGWAHEDFDITQTDSSVSTANQEAGLYCLQTSKTYWIDWVAVGTLGDLPPSGPVGGLIAPTLIAPANTATGVALRPTFTWS